jgi:uncharacterized membrane protein
MSSETLQLILRAVHLVAGFAWIGLLFFFNLVNIPLMKELDAPTKARLFAPLMKRALWWFRWSALLTVIAGIWYWMIILGADARNGRAVAQSAGATEAVNSGWTASSFFLIWTLAWLLTFLVVVVAKADHPTIVGLVYAVAAGAAGYAYVVTNSHGWESNRLLSIGVGGGIGWVMLLNVWGVIWRFNKKLIRWTEQGVASGTAMPPEAARYARVTFLTSRANFGLAFPMLFFMATASHYPIFGR